ncbi:MAG: sporulation protein YqfD [Bacilli bacterium]
MGSNRYLIEIEGINPKRFVRSLINNHFNLLIIKPVGDNYQILVDEANYRRLMATKTIYKLTVIKTRGYIAIWNYLLKRKIFFISLLLGLALLLYLSNIIFHIEVVHTNTKIRELVLEELEYHGIKEHTYAMGFRKREAIITSILERQKDNLEWLEIDRIGTKYLVKVHEKKLNPPVKEYPLQNIVAKKSGIIKHLEASSGEILVKKDTYVKKGDILISGLIYNKENIKNMVASRGMVLAETWYKVTVSLPFHYHEEVLTGNKKQVLSINFLNKSYSLFDFSPYKNKRVKEKVVLFNNHYPISFSYNLEEELNIVDKTYDIPSALVKARELAHLKVNSNLGVKDTIISLKDLKITEEESKITVEVFAKVLEDITEYAPVILPKVN